ncbi:hypothetical protein [Nocardia sp. BMG111209]|uniref:hypothetical protein n=1 Tax=Nocardia sp. BMG111209 TaxID=1160137 RepID=UPI0012DC024C|nr:hypothetical protein [Nocardia sp. BMG111209]
MRAPREDKITLDLEGEDLDPRAVADAIIAVENLLKSLDVTGSLYEPPEGVEYDLTLSELSIGSAHLTLMAPRDRAEVLQMGLSNLSIRPEVPRGWNLKSVQALIDLGKVSRKRGVNEVRLGRHKANARIDAEIQANAEQVLSTRIMALGSVKGTLYRYINDRRRSAALRDYRTGDSVEISFPPALTSGVRRALDSEVEVWGIVERDPDNKLVKIYAEGIEVIHGPDEEVESADPVGLLGGDWTNGLDPVDWVRAQRD